jgi:hypothetical protein
MSGLAAFGGIDINGAHTSHVRAGCTGDYGGTCALVVRPPRWIRRAYEPNGGDGSELGYQGLSMIVTTAAARR